MRLVPWQSDRSAALYSPALFQLGGSDSSQRYPSTPACAGCGLQWQTTDKTAPGITQQQSGEHYRVNAFGVAATVMLPARKASLGVKYFKEFSSRSTFQGYALHISGVIDF